MDKQGEVYKGEAGPELFPGTCSLSLTRTLPAVLLPSPSIESLPSILCHLPGPPAQIPFPYPPMKERVSHFWSPVLSFLLTLSTYCDQGRNFPDVPVLPETLALCVSSAVMMV